MQVVVDSLITQYAESGKGPDVLFLHGWASSGAVFKNLAAEIGKYHRVVMLDLPGFGASERPQEPWDLEQYAQFVAAFIKKAKINPQTIIAHSNGAAIAIKGVAQGVLSPEKLIILGGAGIRPKKSGRNLVLHIVAKTGKAATFMLPQRRRQKIRSKYYQRIGSDYRLVEGMEETFRRVTAEDVLPLTSSITAPTLLVYGEEDEATPPLYGRLYHEAMPNSQLEVIGKAGHFVFEDQPEKVFGLIKDFLK